MATADEPSPEEQKQYEAPNCVIDAVLASSSNWCCKDSYTSLMGVMDDRPILIELHMVCSECQRVYVFKYDCCWKDAEG